MTILTPVGCLQLLSTEKALISISFVQTYCGPGNILPEILKDTERQLLEYFDGKRIEFDLLLAPVGTEFQLKVWKEVSKVKFGNTSTYLEIAKATGSEKITRAVGMANGKNPIPIIIPCHRIIGSNGKLVGYAGGIDKKRWLLKHELEKSQKQNLLF